jgi:hypothetical protein
MTEHTQPQPAKKRALKPKSAVLESQRTVITTDEGDHVTGEGIHRAVDEWMSESPDAGKMMY